MTYNVFSGTLNPTQSIVAALRHAAGTRDPTSARPRDDSELTVMCGAQSLTSVTRTVT